MSNINFNVKFNHVSTGAGKHGSITVTAASNFTLVEKTLRGGFFNEEKIFELSGTKVSNKLTKIATIKIEVSDTSSKMFTRVPYILGTNKFRLKVSKVNYTDRTSSNRGYITSYDLDLMYKSIDASSISDINKESTRIYFNQVNLVNRYKQNTTQVHLLSGFNFGIDNIYLAGETRIIKIQGIPNTEFVLGIINDEDESIIDTSLANFDYTLENGNTVKILKGKIPKSGVYNLNQVFPKSLVLTQTTTANSSVSKIVLNDASKVKIGDIIYSELTDSKNPQVNIGGTTSLDLMTVSDIDPDGDNVNEIAFTGKTFTNSTTNVPVTFARKSEYKIFCNTVVSQSDDFNLFNRTYTLSQNLDPILTFRIKVPSDITLSRITTASTALEFTTKGHQDTSFSAGTDLEIKLRGKYNYDTGGTPLALSGLFLQMLCTHSSANYTSLTAPRITDFSITDNVVATIPRFITFDLGLTRSSFTGVGTQNGTLDLGFVINNYPKQDTTIELDLDNILTHA